MFKKHPKCGEGNLAILDAKKCRIEGIISMKYVRWIIYSNLKGLIFSGTIHTLIESLSVSGPGEN